MPRRPPCSNSLARRIKLTVAYDGTDFCGWAAQAGRRTVQSTLIEAVRRVSGEDTEIVGASRTDSGAHAKGQVCHFDTATPIEPARWTQALNRILPPDVAVCRAAYVSPRFHARFCAGDRRYRYRIATGDRTLRRPIRAIAGANSTSQLCGLRQGNSSGSTTFAASPRSSIQQFGIASENFARSKYPRLGTRCGSMWWARPSSEG